MIVLNVTYSCRPGKRDAFLDAIKAEGLDAASRSEAGNSKYDYYASTQDPDELLLIEHWQDEDALKTHFEQPHFKRLGEIKDEFVENTQIGKYTSQG